MQAYRSLFAFGLSATVALSVSAIASAPVSPDPYPIAGKIVAINRSTETIDLSTATESFSKTVNGKEVCGFKYKILPVTLKSSNALRRIERDLSAEPLRIGDVVSLSGEDFGLGFDKANPVVISLNPVTLKLRQLPSIMSSVDFKMEGSMESQEIKFGDVARIAMQKKGLSLSEISEAEPAILTVNKPQGVRFARFTRLSFKDLAIGQIVNLELTVHPQGVRKANSFDVIIEGKTK